MGRSATSATDDIAPADSGPPARPDPALVLNNVEVRYDEVILVLRGLSLEVGEGEIVALLGSNGAGKTTTLRAISGLLPMEDGEVADGRIEYAGTEIQHRAAHRIAEMGISQVLEGRRVFQHLTVRENLLVGAHVRRDRGAGELERIFYYFPALKTRIGQLAGNLSGGEQQMLATGRALMASPRLLLLDEPSLGLAPILVESIFDIVTRINREESVTILLVEQNARMALAVADFGYVMEGGRVVLEGAADELRVNEDVREFYLGMGEGGRRSYRSAKHYRRRKRWLS